MADKEYETDKRRPSLLVRQLEADTDENTIGTITALVAQDHQHDIKLRTMSWQKAAWLLAGDQVCLAIMAQSWSLSVLGWVPGILTMLGAGARKFQIVPGIVLLLLLDGTVR